MIWILALLLLVQEQADDRKSYVSERILAVYINPDGSERVSEGGSVTLAPMFPGERFFASEEFRKNVDLSPSQETDLNRLLKRIADFRDQFNKKFREENFSDTAAKEYWKFADQIDSDVKKILLDHQFERADQLVQLTSLRQKGIWRWLSEVEPTFEVNVSDDEFAKLDELSKSLAGKLEVELKQLSESTLEAAIKSLDPRQAETFKQQIHNEQIITDFLFAELEFLTSNSDNKASDADSLIDVFRDRVSLFWNPVDQRWNRNAGKIPAWNAVTSICQLLKENESLVIADFSGEQRLAVDELCKEVFRRLQAFSDEQSSPVSKEARSMPDPMFQQFSTELDQYAQDRLLKEILLPHQLEALTKQVEQKKFKRMGPLIRLTRGHFDELLALTSDQRLKIHEDVERSVEKLNEELLKLERSFRNQLIESLDDESQQKLKSAIGDEPKHGQGSLFLVQKSIEKPTENSPPQVPRVKTENGNSPN